MAVDLWKFPSIADDSSLRAIRLNDFEIIAVSFRSVSIFNCLKEEWKQLLKRESDGIQRTLALNSDKSVLYAFNWYGNVTAFDLNQQKSTQHRLKHFVYSATQAISAIHCFGSRKQFTFDVQGKILALKELHDFKKNGYNELYGSSLVHIPSKQKLLLIGGCSNSQFFGIWEFCLNRNEWKKLDIEFNYFHCSTALTLDSKHVIISGGRKGYDNGYVYEDNIHVLDVSNYKLRKCKIKVPLKRLHSLVRIGGGLQSELLVIGWIRNLFKKPEFCQLQLPPVYIMKWICSWAIQQDLHFISENSSEHFAIKMKDILESVIDSHRKSEVTSCFYKKT